ncbi:MAG: response regulator [Bacteroidota bacterium]|nr:response regulator [Bacteroidota bacterium]
MSGRVMIFDDDADLLELCSFVLRSKNYFVKGINKCNNIVHDVREFSPNVILMDNWIPDSGGVKATRLLKNDLILRYIPVVLFSANEKVRDLAAEAGAEFYLPKPFNIDDLEAVITKAIARHRSAGISKVL